ncbi:hypothetical protein [Actinoplanes sp. NPDC026619]|uniref:hypothetical protein n=1 Tax=Actinoplanes sp. NPDC026619 TaxID=3155798 RepID=UPI0033FCBDCF
MLALMAAIALIAVVVGPTLLTGQPLLIAVGIVAAAAVLLVNRRARRIAGRTR